MRKQNLKFNLIAFLLTLSIAVEAQDLPPLSTFYKPVIHTAAAAQVSIGPSSGTGDDTNRLQAAINSLAVNRTTDSNGVSRKGGVLTLNNGTYRIRGLILRTNVHIRCRSGVVIEPSGPGDMIIANGTDIGSCKGCRTTHNFSFAGFSNNSRFTINLARSLNRGDRSRSFRFGNARNFRIGNFNVIDDITQFPTVEFLPGQTEGMVGPSNNRQQRSAAPSRGLIENITGRGYNPGWGVVQIQVGNTLYFRNIEGTGGATIRMESGLGVGLSTLNTENRAIVKLNNLWGRFIRIKNGRCAIFASPHSHIQGFFDMRNITATNSEFAVFLAKGFRDTNNPERPDESNFPIGSFQSNRSTVRNITTTFGNNAQDRRQELRYLPCALRNRVSTTGIPTATNFFPGPSVAPIYNIANSGGPGSYNTRIIGLTANNYRNDVVDIITDPGANDFENCSFTPIENIIFVPNAFKNTPNPLQNGNNRSIIDGDEDVYEDHSSSAIYPNPATDVINIPNASSGTTVGIYTLNGTLVKEIQGLESTAVDVSNLERGVYFVKVITTNNTVSRSIVSLK